MTIFRKRLTVVVTAIEERSRIVEGHKDAQGNETFVTENLGWFIVLNRTIGLGIGFEPPHFAVGDELSLILEKLEPEEPAEPSPNGPRINEENARILLET